MFLQKKSLFDYFFWVDFYVQWIVNNCPHKRRYLVQTNVEVSIPKNTFKDPYLFDFLNLNNSYLEKDLENAILKDLESFTKNLDIDNDLAFDNLDKLLANIDSGEKVLTNTKKYNNPEYRETESDREASGFKMFK